MIRRLFQGLLRAATAASALLFLAAVVLWVRSYRVRHDLSGGWSRVGPHPYSEHYLDFDLERGDLLCTVQTTTYAAGSEVATSAALNPGEVHRRGPTWTWWSERLSPRAPADHQSPRFRWTTVHGTGRPDVQDVYRHVLLPWWAVVAATAVWPAAAGLAALARVVRRRKRRRGAAVAPEPRPGTTRRLLLRAFSLLTTLSVVLFVSILLLWVRSFWVGDRFTRTVLRVRPHAFVDRDLILESARGRLLCYAHTTNYTEGSERAATFRGRAAEVNQWAARWAWYREYDPQPLRNPRFRMLRPTNWVAAAPDGEYTAVARGLLVPWSAVAAAAAVWPSIGAIVAVRRRRDRRRRELGLCPRCGYDLRASTERCPECGEALPCAGPAAAGAKA